MKVWWSICWRWLVLWIVFSLVLNLPFSYAYEWVTHDFDDLTACIRFRPTFFFLTMAVTNWLVHKIPKVPSFLWGGVSRNHEVFKTTELWFTATLVAAATINTYGAIFFSLENWINLKLFFNPVLVLTITIALAVAVSREISHDDLFGEKLDTKPPLTGDPHCLESWRSLKIGMTEAEVRQLIGDPNRIEVSLNAITWNYQSFSKIQFGTTKMVEGWSEPANFRKNGVI